MICTVGTILGEVVPDFAQIAEPLRSMLRKGQSFVWESEQQKAFDKLKMMMTSAEALAYFRNDSKTRIVADAGPEGHRGCVATTARRSVEGCVVCFQESFGCEAALRPNRKGSTRTRMGL